MSQHKIKPSIEIPFFNHNGSLVKTIKNSSRRRNMNTFSFVFRKLKNYFLFRIAFFCPLNCVRVLLHRWRGVNIGKNVYIGIQCHIDNSYPEYVYIENNISIANESMIITHSNPYSHFQNVTCARVAPVVIKQGAWVCVRSLILPGVTIGENAIVSAGAVVDFNIPPYSVVAGNPAKIVARNLPTT